MADLEIVEGGGKEWRAKCTQKFWGATPTFDHVAMRWLLSLAHCIQYTCMALLVQLRPLGRMGKPHSASNYVPKRKIKMFYQYTSQ